MSKIPAPFKLVVPIIEDGIEMGQIEVLRIGAGWFQLLFSGRMTMRAEALENIGWSLMQMAKWKGEEK